MGLQEETKKCLVYISIVKHYFPSAFFFLRIQKCVMQLPVNYQLKHAIYIIYV